MNESFQPIVGDILNFKRYQFVNTFLPLIPVCEYIPSPMAIYRIAEILVGANICVIDRKALRKIYLPLGLLPRLVSFFYHHRAN